MAAFTAAGLSLINVAFSARLARTGSREQWRREQERPIVARCLTLSREAGRTWWEVSVAMEPDIPGAPSEKSAAWDHWREGSNLIRDLQYQVAELDLLASSALRQAALDLVSAHQTESLRVYPAKPRKDFEARQRSGDGLRKLEAELVEAARADLGLGPSGSVPVPKPRSLLGLVQADVRRLWHGS